MANATSCAPVMKATSNGVFQKDNPLHFAFSLLVIQICVVIVVTRSLAFIFRPIRQPRVIAEIIGGVLLGPSALGRSKAFQQHIFPQRANPVLESVANMGLLYFLFMVGLELDLNSLKRTGNKALSIAAAGISLPFAAGIGLAFVLRATISGNVGLREFIVFMGVSMSITAFPVLARILAELKLLTTDVGQIAMAAAAVNDIVAWILLALAIALTGNTSPVVSVYIMLCGLGFVLFMIICVKPLMAWIGRRCEEGEQVSEIYVCITLTAVLACGLITDIIGIHGIFGAFVLGITIPKDGPFAGMLIEKIEDFVSCLLLPLYFASSGLKTNVTTIKGATSWGLLVLVVTCACFGKIFGTLLVAMLFAVPFREGLTLGFLMNTKGLVELIVLNIGKDRGVLNDEVFAILVLMALITTFITTPVVMAIYKPARRQAPYKQRKMQSDKADEELRIVACIHGTRNIPAMINLIEGSRGSNRKRGLRLYIMHLVELSERSSAIMMVHKARRNGLPFFNRNRAQQDRIVVAFQAYGQLSKVAVRPMTGISAMQTMHEDVCNIAHQKRAAIIILPFHKHVRVDGVLESANPGMRHVSMGILKHAPCSVALLVDRGLGGHAQLAPSNVDGRVAVLFFGGPDDREALAFGQRMAEHPGIRLTVFRFTPGKNFAHVSIRLHPDESDDGHVANTYKYPAVTAATKDKQEELDESALQKLKVRAEAEAEAGAQVSSSSSSSSSICYVEREVDNAVDAVREVAKGGKFHLFLVGRGRFPSSNVLLADVADGTGGDNPELGPVGDMLAASDPFIKASVLVIQQHDANAVNANEVPHTKSVHKP